MATPDDTWDLAQADAPPPPSASPAAAGDPTQDYIRQQLALLQAPLPSVQQDTTPAQGGIVGLLGRIGMALAGGSVTDTLSPAQKERAGLRALGDFGTSLMAGSGYYPGKPMFGGLAQGFQGAETSERGSEQQTAAYLGAQQTWQMEQQKLQLERLKEAMPLLQMQYGATIPNPLLSANTPAVPGTATGGGKPGGGGLPAVAYGQGGPGASIPVPTEYMPLFEAAAKRNNMPVDLLIAQARQESGFNPNAAGGGLMQIQDKTALKPGFGMQGVQSPAILKDPATNINFGADYLAARAKAIGADLNTPQGQALALREYNGGGDPDYAAHVTRYMPAAPQATAGATQPPAPYKVATTGAVPGPPSGSTGAPAATPPAPGQTPLAAPTTTADATTPPPAGEPTFEQFRAQNQIDPASLMPDLAQAKAAQAAAAQQLSLARAGRGGDPNKSLSDYNTATDAVNKLQQEANAKVLEAQRQLYGDTMQRQQQAKLKAQELAQTAAENEKNRQAEIRKTELTAGYTQAQKQADADIDIAKNDITDRAADAQKAGRVIPILQQMQSQIGNLPDGFIGTLLGKYDTTGDMTGILAKMGVVDPSKATAAQMLIAARNYLSIEMKPAATGSLRVAEMDKLQSFTPGQLQTPQAQQEMAARLIAYQKRIQDERTFASNYFGRPSDPNNPNSPRIYDNRNLDKAMNAPVQYNQNGVVTGGGLGPVVPEPPPVSASDAEHQAYLNYVNRNLAPGAPYQTWEAKRNEDGRFALDAHGQQIPQRVTKFKVPQ
jgi:soluble lytic murein transglycosylase-like protein